MCLYIMVLRTRVAFGFASYRLEWENVLMMVDENG